MTQRVSPVDVRLRVVALLLEPGLTLARIMALPLDDLQALVTSGYFREARSRGLSFRAIARRFDKSLRTITNISKLAGEQGIPHETSDRVTWRRRLAGVVASRGPVGVAEALGAVPNADRDVLEDELAHLLEEGVLERDGDVLQTAAAHLDLVQEELAPRLDSLRHFLGAATQVAYRRFFAPDAEAEAFARVFTFSATRDDLRRLREAAYELIRDRVFEADGRAEHADDAVTATVSFCAVEAPADHAWKPRST